MATKTTLYLGRNIPRGGIVDWGSLESFLSGFVSKRFPGFTETIGIGFWHGKPEPVALLIVLHNGRPQDDRNIEEIRAEYTKRFEQDCTLREDQTVTWTIEPGKPGGSL